MPLSLNWSKIVDIFKIIASLAMVSPEHGPLKPFATFPQPLQTYTNPVIHSHPLPT